MPEQSVRQLQGADEVGLVDVSGVQGAAPLEVLGPPYAYLQHREVGSGCEWDKLHFSALPWAENTALNLQ